MKALKKQKLLSIALAFLMAATVLFSVTPFVCKSARADSASYTDLTNYYGKRLTNPVSKAFYDILEGMDFASGKSVYIYDKAILDEAASYTVGDPTVLKNLGAAIDSFKYDHTEYFYVDFDKLTLNVKTRGDMLVVELGAGRSDSYFADGFTVQNIPAAVKWYNDELSKFVNGITLDANATAEQKAKAVTAAVASKVTYSFGVDADGNDTEAAPFIRTAYGALKYGLCVCEGYSRLFKAAMDKLGVVNVLINGWLSDNELVSEHMWNLISSDNKWYAADPTVADDDSANSYNPRGLDWAKGELLDTDHIEENVISTSGYEMPFPSVYRDEYEDNEGFEQDGLTVGVVDKTVVVDSQTGATQTYKYFAISYNGMNAVEAQKQGMYVVCRTSSTNEGKEVWDHWGTVLDVGAAFADYAGAVIHEEGVTYLNVGFTADKSKLHFQVGVVDAEPDQQITSGILTRKYYSEEFFEANKVVVMGNVYTNMDNDPDYLAPINVTVDPRSFSLDTADGEQPKNVTVRFSQPLQYKADSTEKTVPVITFTAKSSVDGTEYNDIGSYASVSSVSLSEDRTSITFVFSASVSYSHNEVVYTFHVENMECVYANGTIAAAKDFTIYTKRTSIICTKVYGDGRLYMQAFGTPSLVDNSDLSVAGWEYKDDNNETRKVSQSQRSQLALVVKTPANKDTLESEVQKNLGANDTIAATYELDLNICGKIATIPEGSYMKLSFGFPAGITAEDEGVEFEVFHFKKDAQGNLDYSNPERLQCVVTKYGLTVTVNSFSPFVLVKHTGTTNAARKGILTALNGAGGTVKADTGKPVNFLDSDGQSVTYTLTPDSGYAVEYVMLGNKELVVNNGKVTVNYSDLSSKNNILNIGFAKQSVLDSEKAAGEVNTAKSFAANTYNNEYAAKPAYKYPTSDKDLVSSKGLSGGIIAVIVIAAVLVLAGAGAAVWYFVIRPKKAESSAASKTARKQRK